MNTNITTTDKVGDNAVLYFNTVPIVSSRQRSIADMCEGKRVLVIGCADMVDMIDIRAHIQSGKHQFHNISQTASYCVGVDINKAGIELLQTMHYNAIHCDVFTEHHSMFDEEYDYCVLSHVIEHVMDLTGFINAIKQKVNAKAFIFAVPNAYNVKHAIPSLLLQREQVSNDHFYTFTPITFVKLLEGLDFTLEALYFDKDSTIALGKRHKLLGGLWSWIKSKWFKHSGDLVAIARLNTSPKR